MSKTWLYCSENQIAIDPMRLGSPSYRPKDMIRTPAIGAAIMIMGNGMNGYNDVDLAVTPQRWRYVHPSFVSEDDMVPMPIRARGPMENIRFGSLVMGDFIEVNDDFPEVILRRTSIKDVTSVVMGVIEEAIGTVIEPHRSQPLSGRKFLSQKDLGHSSRFIAYGVNGYIKPSNFPTPLMNLAQAVNDKYFTAAVAAMVLDHEDCGWFSGRWKNQSVGSLYERDFYAGDHKEYTRRAIQEAKNLLD